MTDIRKYLYNEKAAGAEEYPFDVLIIGSGIAGLYAALHLDESLQCAMVTKANIDESNSYLAQGGIAAVMSKDDDFEGHIQDTLTAGAGLCELEAVKVLVEEGPENIRTLIDMQIPFDVNSEGDLLITREGGHHMRRIVHCGGDATGKETTKQLGRLALKKENLHFFFESYLVDLLTDEKGVCGAVVMVGEEYRIFRSRNVILATGGIGQIYEYTTNPTGAVGDGIAAAHRAGAVLSNMEMVQFHPTTLIADDKPDRLFLISEAVRGEGAILRNSRGEAFMKDKHELADLAPRDIVTREIIKELDRINESHVFLDASSMTTEFFSNRFPTIYNQCLNKGINLTADYIPVRPAQHYLMGGVKTDLDARTSIEGLYCCGESAESGIHGGNRLASNSVLECLVFGRRAARHINANFRPSGEKNVGPANVEALGSIAFSNRFYEQAEKTVKRIMTKYAGPERSFDGMLKGIKELEEIKEQLDSAYLSNPYHYKVYNMMQNALCILESAYARKESVGAHYIVASLED
ncbi:MAG: L-aspartate oxidase [Clostridia bacterium]|nr:L-aspartate oxidase [Clostridia bacterium]